ncbi:MAG: hypothetical protein D6800_12400, partial [Candidatus Zixiibacteriota bacterium]
MSRTLALSGVLAGLLAIVSPAQAQRRQVQQEEVHGHTLYTVLRPGDIPAIFDPEFISVDEA